MVEEVQGEFTTIRIRNTTKDQLLKLGSMQDTFEDVLLRVLKNNKLYLQFIVESGKGLAWDKWFASHKEEAGVNENR